MTTIIARALWQRLPLQTRRSLQVPHIVGIVSALFYKRHEPSLTISGLADKRWNWLKWGGALLAGVVGVSMQKTAFAESPKNCCGRENELKALKNHLSKGKIVYLQGQAGVGKTQIAYEHLNRGQYQKHYVVDCKSKEAFEKDLAKYFPVVSLEKIRHFLAVERNYLLILHGVNKAEMAKEIRSLLQSEVGGHVIITGKHDSLSASFCTFRVFGVEAKDGISIFREKLSLTHREKFDKLKQEDKEELISLLKGSPALIEIAAKELGRLWGDPKAPKDLIALVKKVTSLDPKDVHELMEGVKNGYADSVEAVRQCFNGRDLTQHMVNDVLYFYAFHFIQDKVLVPTYRDGDVLRELFAAASNRIVDIQVSSSTIIKSLEDRSYFYRSHTGEEISRSFLDVTEKLEEHGLLIRKEVGGLEFEKMTLSFRWWVINHFYETEFKLLSRNVNIRLKGMKNDKDSITLRCESEREKAKWLIHFVPYFNQISTLKPFDADQFSQLIGFFECIKKYDITSELQLEIINSLDWWRAIKKALKQERYPDIVSKYLGSLSSKQLQLLIDQLLQERGDKYDPFFLGRVYQLMAEKEKGTKQSQLLEKAIKEYSLAIEKTGDSIAYNNRAYCHPENSEGLKKSLLDLEQAIKKDPFNAVYRKNLSSYLKKNRDFIREAREIKIADGLSHMENVSKKQSKTFSKEYKKLILNFLLSVKTFEWDDEKERWRGHTMDDKGILFGETLRYNPSIEEIALNGCHLSDEGMVSIAGSLVHNKSLKILHLDWNNEVKSKGIHALADALKDHPQITELSLRRSDKISADDIVYLIDKAPKKLKKIHLSISSTIKDSKSTLEAHAKGKKIAILWSE